MMTEPLVSWLIKVQDHQNDRTEAYLVYAQSSSEAQFLAKEVFLDFNPNSSGQNVTTMNLTLFPKP